VCPQIDAVQQPNGCDRLSPFFSASTSPCSARRAAADQCVERFPADLLSDLSSPSQEVDIRATTWWLGHTRPRQEKAVANDLFARRIPFYLPLVMRKAITRGRTRHVRIPLFSGYVFICGSEAERLSALKTNRLLTIQQVPDGNSLRRQLISIAQLIAAGAPLVREARLAAGERVRIKTGLFRGIEGIVLRRHGKTELLIAIDFLGQGVSIEIEDCSAEPA
jgi:hypothetical protein